MWKLALSLFLLGLGCPRPDLNPRLGVLQLVLIDSASNRGGSVNKRHYLQSKFLGSPWDGSLLMAHRGHKCGTWGESDGVFDDILEDVLQSFVATQIPEDAPTGNFRLG